VVGALVAVLAFVGTVQLRSQAEVQRTLEGQDATALAFLIDDVHRANDALAEELISLTARRDALRTGGSSEAARQLQDEATRLRVVEGLVPVHGPGVTLTVDAPLTPFDVEDAVNNLRAGGAEAVALNGHRLVMGTVIRQAGDGISVDGVVARGPWTFVAIGDPDRLQATARLMTQSLRSDPRVRRADYRAEPDTVIRSTAAPRPFVYGSP